MSEKPQEEFLYTVKDGSGYLIHTHINPDPNKAIKDFMDTENTMLSIYNLGRISKGEKPKAFPTWKEYLADGFSVVPVEIVEIVEAKAEGRE